MALPDGVPYFQIPDDYDTISNWFWGPIAPVVGNMQQAAAGGTAHPTYYSNITGLGGSTMSGMFGGDGGNYRIGRRSVAGESLQFLAGLDENLAQWGDWIITDPRDRLASNLSSVYANPAFDVRGNGIDVNQTLNMLSSQFAIEALRQKFSDLGITDAGFNQAVEGLFNPGQAAAGATGVYANAPYPYVPDPNAVNDPTWGSVAKLFSDAGLTFGLPSRVGEYAGSSVADITDANLLAALQAAGIAPAAPTPTPTTNPAVTQPLPVANASQEAAMASNTDGVSPTALNPASSWLYGLFGKTLKGFDSNGNPVFEDNPNAIFGDAQRQQLAEFLTPLGLSGAETYGRNLLTEANLQPGFQNALNIFDQQVIPGLSDLAETGFRTPTPDLYGADQYDYARNLMDTPLYGQQSKDLLNQFMTKGVPDATRNAAYRDFNQHAAQDIKANNVGQTGSFSTDYLGALARGTADITNQLAKDSADYQFRGLGLSNMMDTTQRDADSQALGILNQMTQGQGTLESALNEAAAARRIGGLSQLGSTATARAQLPLTWGQDVMNAGGAMRLTDESMRPGGRVLDIFQSLLTGASPGNLGYVAQGQLPSSTTSLISGLAPFGAAFGQSGGGSNNFFGSLLNSAGSGLGNWLGNNAGSLISSGWNALTGIFGGGGSAQTSTGASYGNPSSPTYMYPYKGGNNWWGSTLD